MEQSGCAGRIPCGFDTLFNKNVPHILENIFFNLDYKAYKACLEVNTTWRKLLTSEFYKAKTKLLFCEQLLEDARELIRVSGEGNVEEARKLLSSGMVDVNYQDAICTGRRKLKNRGRTPLHFSAIHGKKEFVELLITNGADVNIADNLGKTPLHKAASLGKKDMAEILIANGAKLNTADESGKTPLHEAALRGHCRVLQFLLTNSAKVNITDNLGKTPLHEAVQKGQIEAAKILIENGADPRKEDVNEVDNEGLTPLHRAAISGCSKEMVKLLISMGADTKITDKSGRTALQYAARHGKKTAAELLIACLGINKALIQAICNQDNELAKLLVTSGADVTKVDESGRTPLHHAAVHRMKDLAKLLVAYGADASVLESFETQALGIHSQAISDACTKRTGLSDWFVEATKEGAATKVGSLASPP